VNTERRRGTTSVSQAPLPLLEGADLRHPLDDVQKEIHALRVELAAVSERYRELYDLAPVGYIVIGDQGIVDANATAERLFGMHREDLRGRALASFVVPEDLDELLHHERLVLQSPGSRSCELALLVQGGERRDVRLESVRAKSTPDQWRSAIVDVSEQKRLERQLVESARRDAIGPVARGLAHDICHVLNSILNDAERVQAAPTDSARVQQLGEQIKALALHGGSVVQSVLERARADGGAREIADLNEIVLQAENLLRRLAGESTRMRVELRAARPWVTIARSEIEQVLSNLVSNARDAMGGRGELSIETRDPGPSDEAVLPGGDCVVLSISDTGVGMDPLTQARAFDPHFTTKPAGQGNGLGLPTVYGIVKAAGGEIRVRSQRGKGTTMEVYLPLQGSAAADQRPSQPMRVGLPPTRVLVVEEDPLVCLATCRVLEQAGYEVLQAQSGREAMVVLGAYSDSLKIVISHVELPDVSGFDLVRAVHAACPTIRVLLTTTEDPRLLSERVQLPPRTEVLRKPFGHGVLVDRVRRVLATNEGRPVVLVVEDDVSALSAHEELLTREGFRVVGAGSAGEALEWLVNHVGEAAALVTDLHLADADGGWLARELRALGDDIPILFLTGSAANDPLLHGLIGSPRTALLAKPAESVKLAGAVRRLISAG